MSKDEEEDARSLARELAEKLAALSTQPPGTAPPRAGADSALNTGLTLDGPRSILENGARFVSPVLPAEARFKAGKRLLLRLLRVVTRDQTVFNSAVAEALRTALHEIEAAYGALARAHAAETRRRRHLDEELQRALDAVKRDREEARAAREGVQALTAELRDEQAARERAEAAFKEAEARIEAAAGVLEEKLADAILREQGAREALERDRDVRFEELARWREGDERDRATLAEDLRQVKLQWTTLRRELREGGLAAAPAAARESVPAPALTPAAGDALLSGVYTDFERQFRGSEEEIRERQRADVELFRGAPGPVVDLGCGRGELLELLREAGIPSKGCDANPAMVERAREKGLSVDRADLFSWLAGAADGSLGGITAYQVVEHLAPASLFTLVELCAAKLAPGGRLLFETVNPESVYAMRWFWMDLTHVRPVPAPSLAQLLGASGFRDVTISYRSPVPEHEAMPPESASTPALAAVAKLLFAPQDYAVTGTR